MAPQKVQSFLTTWRPKIGFRLKNKFSRSSEGDVSNEDGEDDDTNSGTDSKAQLIRSREQLLDTDYIVDSAPSPPNSAASKMYAQTVTLEKAPFTSVKSPPPQPQQQYFVSQNTTPTQQQQQQHQMMAPSAAQNRMVVNGGRGVNLSASAAPTPAGRQQMMMVPSSAAGGEVNGTGRKAVRFSEGKCCCREIGSCLGITILECLSSL